MNSFTKTSIVFTLLLSIILFSYGQENVNVKPIEILSTENFLDNDIGIYTILSPNSGYPCFSDEEPVTIRIQNLGNYPQSNFDVSYTFNDTEAVFETIDTILTPFSFIEYTFEQTVNLQYFATFQIESCTHLTNDEDSSNDCKTKSLFGPILCPAYYVHGCILFDGIDNFSLAQINNYNSGCADVSGTGWSQYLEMGLAQLYTGYDHTITMSTNGNYDNFVSVWIDWNNDNFLDSSEIIINNFELLEDDWNYVNFSVPEDAPLGQHVMRARTNRNDSCNHPYEEYIYGEAEDYWVNISDAADLLPPQNLVVELINGNDVFLEWDPPEGYNNWLFWDDQVNYDGISAGGFFYCASRWEPDDLVSYDGMYLSKISYFNCGSDAMYEVMVWKGEDADTLLLSQNVGTSLVGDWNEIELDTPVLIEATEELWFGFSVLSSGSELSAGIDDGPAILYKGDLISLDGVNWASLSSEYGLDYNWNLAGYVSGNIDGKELAIPLDKKNVENDVFQKNSNTKLQTSISSVKTKNENTNNELLGYNIYEDSILIGNTTEEEFYIYDLVPGIWEYYVTALYDEGESEPSNEVVVFCTLQPPENFTATVFDETNVYLECDPPFGMTPDSYNFYRNDTLIGNSITTEFNDIDLSTGTYLYHSTAVYGNDESSGSNFKAIEINPDYCEDFDYLIPGFYVADQLGDMWTTWNGAPGGPEDALVSNNNSQSPSNSFVVNNPTTDLLFKFADETITNGLNYYSHYMFIPSGNSGYFNVQADNEPGVVWAFELYFNDGGTGSVTEDNGSEYFTYNQDVWFLVEINFDLTYDNAEIMIDNNLIYELENISSIGGINYFGWEDVGSTCTYYDDVCFEPEYWWVIPAPMNLTAEYQDVDIVLMWDPPEIMKPEEDLLGYNVYHSYESGDYYFLDFTSDIIYTHLSPPIGFHCYVVAAAYEFGESLPCEEACVLYDQLNEYSIHEVQVYPNPATNVLHISSESEISTISLYNFVGQAVTSELIYGSEYTLKTSELESGLYFVKIETDIGLFSKKIIIK